jgi:serine/threonine protein kinase
MSQPPDNDRTMMPPPDESAAVLEWGNNALPVGTMLGEFEILGVIGEGGFGIVYEAYDRSLQRHVALKEYMPSALAAHSSAARVTVKSRRHVETFQTGLRSFVNEARLLAQFDHPALVKVYRFWEDNGTAYMVMPYYHGKTLKEALSSQPGPPDEAWLRHLLAPLLDALEVIHDAQCIHRDIAPDNILILEDGSPLLLDFGAARRAIGGKTDAFTVIVKQHYAPIEQYAEVPAMRQGPWTDLYALASVVYFAITGKPPSAAVTRHISDTHTPLEQAAAGRYSPAFLQALDHCLAVKPEQRPQSVAELRQALGLRSGMPGAHGATQATPPPERLRRRLAWGGGLSALALAGVFAAIGLMPDKDAALPRQPPAATPASAPPPAALPSSEAQASKPFDPIQALDEVFQARNRDHAVTVSLEQAQVKIGKDRLRFSIRSSRPGYVYLMMVGTDRSQFWLLFPNAIDSDNRINAEAELALPRAKWHMVAGGPPGTNQFVAMVSDAPRDFHAAGLKDLAPYAEFPLAALAALPPVPEGQAPLLAGKPACDAAAPACSASYGAAVFSIAEIAP